MSFALGAFMLGLWFISWPLTRLVERLAGLDEPEVEHADQ